jgi:hypothetical protein
MNPGRILRAGITASAAAHLSVFMLVLFFTEVHPFGSITVEPITVEIVSPAEAPPDPKKEEPLPEPMAKPSGTFDLPSKPEVLNSPPSAASPSAASPPVVPPRQQTALPPPSPNAPPVNAQPQQPAKSPTPAYTPPEPDLSVKYHVMLGLPPDLSAEPPKGEPGGDVGDEASKSADIASSLIAEFRRRLRTCSKLPPSIAASDRLKIKLRVPMTPEGRLASDPVLIEASASAKGPALMQAAIAALESCQPYAMLPVDRYGEWKVLDLTFTPLDFPG